MPLQEFQRGNHTFSENVQIWSASLDLEDCSHFSPLLSENEKNRAFRLKDRVAASRQIISRGILRLLLSSYTKVRPEELVFEYSKFGKPYLSYPANSKISFNLTHSGDLLLLVVGGQQHIGIDVEKIDGHKDFKEISNLAFSPDEQRSLSLSEDPVNDFYQLWTAKEAVLKASGQGFSYPSNQFSVFISKGKTILSEKPTDFAEDCTCSISSFSPMPGFSAAVAILQ
jgi:4'-phosphopantetheinyl transferase